MSAQLISSVPGQNGRIADHGLRGALGLSWNSSCDPNELCQLYDGLSVVWGIVIIFIAK